MYTINYDIKLIVFEYAYVKETYTYDCLYVSTEPSDSF